MQRNLFTEDHEAFRALARDFIEKEVVPAYPEWEKGGRMPRDVFKQMGELGMLGMAIPEEYGGGGSTDFRYSAVLAEEFTRAGAPGLAIGLHNDIIGPYLTGLATDEQKRRWLPGFCSGETITAIAMTEPGAGSD
nr:acyl-CoA dehydrogenase family protein [Streptomyces sp. DSM 41633]